MQIIILLVNLFIFIVSGIAIFSYYRNRRFQKKKENIVRGVLDACRTVTHEEIQAIRQIYKTDVSPDEPVYRIEGPLESIELTVNGNKTEEFWIGGVQLDTSLAAVISRLNREGANDWEFLFLPNKAKKACPLVLNGATIHSYFCEMDGEKAPAPGSFRDADEYEQAYLYRPVRWYTLPLLLLSLIPGSLMIQSLERNEGDFIAYGIITAILFLAVLILPWPGRKYREGRGEVRRLRSCLREVPGKKGRKRSWRPEGIDVKLKIPRNRTIPSFQPGLAYELDICFRARQGKLKGTLLSVNGASLIKPKKVRISYWAVAIQTVAFAIAGLITAGIAPKEMTAAGAYSFFSGPVKSVETREDLSLLNPGDRFSFGDLILASTYYNFFLTVPEGYAIPDELDGETERLIPLMATFFTRFNADMAGLLRDEHNNPVSLLDEDFSRISPLYTNDVRELKRIFTERWQFPQDAPTMTLYKAFIISGGEATNLQPVMKAILKFMTSEARHYIARQYENNHFDLVRSIERDAPSYEKISFFLPPEGQVKTSPYEDPRWNSRDPDILEDLYRDELTGQQQYVYLQGEYYLKKYRPKNSVGNYEGYKADRYELGTLSEGRSAALARLASLIFFALGLLSGLLLTGGVLFPIICRKNKY